VDQHGTVLVVHQVTVEVVLPLLLLLLKSIPHQENANVKVVGVQRR
jgi:hypothetical protein